jgi:hypothetical protein
MPTAANLFNIIACLQEHEGVRLRVAAQVLRLWMEQVLQQRVCGLTKGIDDRDTLPYEAVLHVL